MIWAMSAPGKHRDMTAPNWARTVKSLRKAAARLRLFGFTVTEPAALETPPCDQDPA